MKKKFRLTVGLVIIIAGIGIYLYPNIREWELNLHTQKLIAEFDEKYTKETEETGKETKGKTEQKTEEMPYQELYDEMLAYNENLIENGQQLVDAWSYAQEPIDLTALSNDDGAIGYIEIPAMDVVLPLYIGATTENMAKGATVMSETSMPIGGENTNCVIAGHRGYSGMPYFREIEKLEIDDSIYITNPWETLTYTVTEINIIDPDDVESILIVPGKDMVTLLTCHPYMSHGKYRYVVYCERVEEDAHTVDTDEENSNELLTNSGGLITETDSNGLLTDSESSELFITIEKGLRIFIPAVILCCVVVTWLRRRRKKKLHK